MQLNVTIPMLLQDCVGGTRHVSVDADRLDIAIERIRQQFPLLRPHVWDDAGQVRQHVLVFYNDTALRWLDTLEIELKAGDRVTIVQAISGG